MQVLSAKCCANFGQGTGPILVDGLACSGTEELLEDCRHEGWGSHNCQHYEDAGVVCTGESTQFVRHRGLFALLWQK